MTRVSDSPSVPAVATAPSSEPRPEDLVELVEPSTARTWSAVWLSIGVAILLGGTLLASAEVFLALKEPLVAALLGGAHE